MRRLPFAAQRARRGKGEAYLAGGFAEGWEAPPLTSLSHAPIPWSEDELFAYLRTGESRFHGVAAGPMAPVVKELAHLPDQDIRAMAVYLGSFNDKAIDKATQDALAAKRLKLRPHTRALRRPRSARGSIRAPARSAIEVGGAPLFGSRPSLALNSNLHSAVPDNLIQVILHGIAAAGVERSRLHARLQGQHFNRSSDGTRVLPAATIRARQAALGRCSRGRQPGHAGGITLSDVNDPQRLQEANLR